MMRENIKERIIDKKCSSDEDEKEISIIEEAEYLSNIEEEIDVNLFAYLFLLRGHLAGPSK